MSNIIHRQYLRYCHLDDKVKLTPQGKVYRVVKSNESDYAPSLEDVKTKKIIKKSPWIEVYLLKS